MMLKILMLTEDPAVADVPVRDAADSRYRIHGPPRTWDGPLHVHLSTRACPRVRKRHGHAHAFMLLLATPPGSVERGQ